MVHASPCVAAERTERGHFRYSFRPLAAWFFASLALLTWDAYRRTTLGFRLSIDMGELNDLAFKIDGERFVPGQWVKPGRRKLEVAATDADPVEREVFVWLGVRDLGTIGLTRSRGTLSVKVSPGPAKIEIQGRFLTNSLSAAGAPAVFTSVPVGTYRVTASFAHSQEERQADVVRNRTTRLDLQGKLGALSLSTVPADSDFELGGWSGHEIRIKGKSPAALLQLPPGQYTLEVARNDYRKKLRVDVTAGQTNDLNVSFEYAEISVATEPDGATLYLNEKEAGLTPKTLTELRPGRYQLRFELKGFLPVTTTIDVKGNESLVVSTNLMNEAYVGAMQNARRFGGASPPDFDRALASLEEALGVKAGDRAANELKEKFKSARARAAQDKEAAALAARRQAALAKFKRATDGEVDSEMFDTFTWTLETSLSQVKDALFRSLQREPIVWVFKSDSTPDEQTYIVTCTGKGPLARYFNATVLFSEISPREVIIHAKFWEYAIRQTQELVFLIKGRECLLPLHPRHAENSSVASYIETRRKKTGEDFKTRLIRELQ